MWTWLLALLPPSIVLAGLGAAHALATPSCSVQALPWLHALYAGTIAANLLLTVLAWRVGNRLGVGGSVPVSTTLAFGLGALFTLLPLVQWLVMLPRFSCGS